MKYRRLIGLVSGLCLAVSLMIPAYATEIQSSEFAGETLQCQVVKISDDGTATSTMIGVDIPATATKSDQKELVQAAILGTAEPSPMLASTRAVFDTISTKSDLTISKNLMTTVGNGTLPTAYATLVAEFDGITHYNGIPNMTVAFINGSISDKVTVKVDKASSVLAILKSESKLPMGKNDNITIKATLDIGTIDVGTCTLLASQYNYS